MRRTDDGSLVLDKGLVPTRARAVRVRVKKQDKITGSSSLSRFVAAARAEDSAERMILQSRDTLFEEELFHEVNREARALVSSGVTARKDLIEFEYELGEQILLELVELDDAVDDSETNADAVVNNNEAEAIAHALRILLSYAHRLNLRRRSQFPPPLTNQKRHSPPYQLLRPILSYMQHDAHTRSLESFLQDVYEVFNVAGLSSNYQITKLSSLRLQNSGADQPATTSGVEELLDQFMGPLESRISGIMVNSSSSYNIRIHTTTPDTSSRQIALGTEYELTIRLPNYPHTQPPSRIGLKHEVESILLRLFTLDLITYISSIATRRAPDGVATTAFDGQEPLQSKDFLTWEAPFPHHGEILGIAQDGRTVKQLSIDLCRDSLTLSMRGCDQEMAKTSVKTEPDQVSNNQDGSAAHPDDDEGAEFGDSEFVIGAGGLKYTRPPQQLVDGEIVHVWRIGDAKSKSLSEVVRDISISS